MIPKDLMQHLACAACACGLALAGATAAEPVAIQHDGLALNGEWTVGDGAPADRAVVLLHGTLAHHRMEIIANLQSLLAERGISTLAVSLSLGISDREGMYDCKQVHTHRHLDALPELDAWIGWLEARGVRRAVLLGHSRGGNQVARYVLDRPDAPVDGVVLVAPMTYDAERVRARYEAEHQVSLDDRLNTARAVGADSVIDAPFLHCGQARVSAESFLSYYADDPAFDTPSLIARLSVPVLAVAGTADETVPDLAERLPALARGASRILIVEDADHFFLDFYAEDLADAVKAFVGESAD